MDRADLPKKADEGDQQCEFVRPKFGQCEYIAVEGGNKCMLHGGAIIRKSIVKQNLYERLAREYRDRMNEFKNHDAHFSLQEEIGILRLSVEAIMNSCKDNPSLFLRNVGQISELTVKIQKLVDSSMRAEKYIGTLMSREQVGRMLQDVINVIAEEVTDQDTLERIARQFEFIVNKEYVDDSEQRAS